jgi:mRNA-degrading endonuclease toxin of MazEF toxin-antitoxin module
MSGPELGYPLRGEIWWAQFSTDPPGKLRPAIIVSQNARNAHPRAGSVLTIPLSTSIYKLRPDQMLLTAGETGMKEDSVAWTGNISALGKSQLRNPVEGHRPLTNTRICALAELVQMAMGCG